MGLDRMIVSRYFGGEFIWTVCHEAAARSRAGRRSELDATLGTHHGSHLYELVLVEGGLCVEWCDGRTAEVWRLAQIGPLRLTQATTGIAPYPKSKKKDPFSKTYGAAV